MNTGLLIMAAGMGSRFGGLKQAAGVGPEGQMIIDYSVHDALAAGFDKIVMVIRRDIEKDFREACGKRIEKIADVRYVYQDMDNLPEGFSVPDDRAKPWGTGHAVLCARKELDVPFAVINADDFYGASVYKDVHDFLVAETDICMAGYKLGNTLSENDTVCRGVCSTENGYLKSVTETLDIPFNTDIPLDTTVSMNLWGLRPEHLDIFEEEFVKFLNEKISMPKSEFYIPLVIDNLINERNYKVKVLDTDEKWYGITYKEDLPLIQSAIRKMTDAGLYK
ncbi:MAG: nucleotidyltransferase [Clostridia bacterium]|nr:nucleotidyltransferase [Clostridia bacterium]